MVNTGHLIDENVPALSLIDRVIHIDVNTQELCILPTFLDGYGWTIVRNIWFLQIPLEERATEIAA